MKKLILLSLLCSGCATIPHPKYTEEAYQRNCSKWISKDINDLILAKGPPTSTFEMPNKNKMFTWVDEQKKTFYHTSSQTTFYKPFPYSALESDTVSTTVVDERHFICKTTFISDPVGKIWNWLLSGNICVALDLQNLTEDQKKLLFFESLKKGDVIEITLSGSPSISRFVKFVDVSDQGHITIFVGVSLGRISMRNFYRSINFDAIVKYNRVIEK